MKQKRINMKNSIKILTGVLTMSTLVFGQTFYSNVLLNGESYYNARARALGGVSLAEMAHPSSLTSNPAVAVGMKGFHLAITGKGLHLRERRSFPVQDTFGDFLTDNDYVHNRYWNIDAGFLLGYGGSVWTAMLGYTPVSNLNYTYEEEIRSATYDYNRDPLVGYHQVEFGGQISGLSAGMSWSPLKQLGVGISATLLTGRDIERGLGVTVLDRPDERLASDTTTFNLISSDFQGGMDLRVGSLVHLSKRHTIHLAYTLAGDVEFENPGVIARMDSNLVMPVYSVDKNVLKQTVKRPSTFSVGFRYIPENILKTELFAQADLTLWNQFESEYAGRDTSNFKPDWDNTWTIRGGVEHVFSSGIPMRAGWSYSKSPVRNELNRSDVHFGTGYQIESLTLDLNVSWYEMIYHYNDLFPIEGEVRVSRDKVREAGVRVMATLTYSL
jgi:long-subunit fatty acid transport protein